MAIILHNEMQQKEGCKYHYQMTNTKQVKQDFT